MARCAAGLTLPQPLRLCGWLRARGWRSGGRKEPAKEFAGKNIQRIHGGAQDGGMLCLSLYGVLGHHSRKFTSSQLDG